jgi:hypothetical protein
MGVDMKTPLLGSVAALLFFVSTATTFAVEIDRVQPCLPMGVWRVKSAYIIGENGERLTENKSDRCIRFDAKSFRAFIGDSSTPCVSGEVEILRLPIDGDGLLKIKTQNQGTFVVIYRLRGDWLELCYTASKPDQKPAHFGAKGSYVLRMIAIQPDRIISTDQPVPLNETGGNDNPNDN